MTPEDHMVANGLPKDFGPGHPDWNTPSKMARYYSAMAQLRAEVDLGGTEPEQKPLSMGLAVSTYMSGVPSEREHIFMSSIYSLLASGFPGEIVVVDDGSPYKQHLRTVEGEKRIRIVTRAENGGVSRCKNTCLRELAQCDHVFLADDDVMYSGGWWRPYVTASIRSGILHFSFFDAAFNSATLSDSVPPRETTYNGVKIVCANSLLGSFLYLRRSAIETIGGFKVFSYKYGGEHVNYTMRAVAAGFCPGYCDVPESNTHLRINLSSLASRSIAVDTGASTKQYYDAVNSKTIREEIVE